MQKQGPINLVLFGASQMKIQIIKWALKTNKSLINLVLFGASQMKIQIIKWALKTNQSLINQIFSPEAITIKNKMKMMNRLVANSQ